MSTVSQIEKCTQAGFEGQRNRNIEPELLAGRMRLV